jgi:hypothetical protein
VSRFPLEGLRAQLAAEDRLRHTPPPFVGADQGFHHPGIAVPIGRAARHGLAAAERSRNSDFCAMRFRVEAAIAHIKSCHVASDKFRSPNALFHSDCVIAATLLSIFMHARDAHGL